jgi:hypothetical protein
MDRALASGAKGCGFESRQARVLYTAQINYFNLSFFFLTYSLLPYPLYPVPYPLYPKSLS